MGQESKYIPLQRSKQNVEIKDLDRSKADAIKNASAVARQIRSGVGGGQRFEAIPAFNQSDTETLVAGSGELVNSWIVLGVDRPSTKTTGYGGKGHTQCAAIDMVAGRMASYAREVDNEGELIFSNPDFKIDAARIYISQKADIDDYFELTEGSIGKSKSKSAVAVKADDVRIVARNGIKLVTGTDTRNSQGMRQMGTRGIDLIAGNQGDDMQPLVKGDNLLNCLKDLQEQIEDLREIVYSLLKYQSSFNQKLISHRHISPFQIGGKVLRTAPAYQMMPQGMQTVIQHTAQTELSIISHQTNMATWGANYLNPAATSYINSGHNKTN